MKIFTILIILICASFSSYAQVDKMTKSLNDYSFDLYNQIKSDNKNLFISPLSTYYALLMAYEGAQNDTKREFENVFHLGSADYSSNLKDFSENLISFKDSANYLNISNALWLQKDFVVNDNFKNKIKQKYSSDLKTVDFKQKIIAANEINDWVAIKTNGLIKNILSPDNITNDTRFVISNAIYFLGKWNKEFDKNLTKPDNFYALNKEKSEIDFMNKTEYLNYYENNDIQFISKPYEGNAQSLCIILPKERNKLSDLERTLDNSGLENILNNLSYSYIKLSIPKFKLETSYALIEPLQNLGLKEAFTPRADFSGMASGDSLFLHGVIHKTFIRMDEKKTKAAAATVISMEIRGLLPEPKIFKADHPFTFMIIDNQTKGIIFMGRYVQPE
jgi:serpin B